MHIPSQETYLYYSNGLLEINTLDSIIKCINLKRPQQHNQEDIIGQADLCESSNLSEEVTMYSVRTREAS